MNNTATILAAALVALGAAGRPAQADGIPVPKEEREGSAVQVAAAWFSALARGDTAVAAALSDVPFAYDGPQEVRSHTELKRLFDLVVARKGRRDLRPESVRVVDATPERIDVALSIGDETVVIRVRPGDACRVVGFRD